MRVWRICARRYAATALTGVGGIYASGRWHHRGQLIVYTSATPSLAALEVLVHFDPSLAPSDLTLVECYVPDDLTVESFDPTTLAPDWDAYPGPVALQDFGTRWLSEMRSPVLSVPSAVMSLERNLLLNSAHPDAARASVVLARPFSFDPRLLGP